MMIEIIATIFAWSIRILLLLVLLLILCWLLLARPAFVAETKFVNASAKVDQQLLQQHVKALSVDLAPRDYRHVDNLNRVADYIKTQFEAQGLTVKQQPFSVGGNEYKNVYVELGAHNSGPKIIVGAHYDAAGPYPGADDNASGVAGLLELARLLKDQVLSKNITLIAYTLEEVTPFGQHDTIGSHHHAALERQHGSDVELMISLEMIGYYNDLPGSQSYPLKLLHLFYPPQGNFIAVVDQVFSTWGRKMKIAMSRAADVPVYSINAPRFIRGVDFSDHRSFWEYGYPAVMLTDTSFYRNDAYHSAQDTYDRLNYQTMADVVVGVYSFLQELASASS